SPRTVTAIAAESTGEIPTMIAVREGPMTPTARVNRIWLIPGANNPVTKNGHVSFHTTFEESPVTTDRKAQIKHAITVVTNAAASVSMPRASARRIVTARAPKKSAEPAARRTTRIGAAGFEPATSAAQPQHSNQAH